MRNIWSWTVLVGVLLAPEARGETSGAETPGPTRLAEWQRRLTLGAGDVLDISLYEQPETLRAGVTIDAAGRLDYLEAREVMAAELTIDELRQRLEQVLARYYRPPLRVIILPQAYRSKKYHLLGNVVRPGVYPLDRPVTLLQAIAAAGGFAGGVQRRPLLDLARSYVLRRGPSNKVERLSVNLEGLFLRGDLSQDIALAPEDYLYFPAAEAREGRR